MDAEPVQRGQPHELYRSSLIELTTIREALYLGMHNDVSFLISSLMNLYEQQSSYNPNMPLRLLQYAGNVFDWKRTERR